MTGHCKIAKQKNDQPLYDFLHSNMTSGQKAYSMHFPNSYNAFVTVYSIHRLVFYNPQPVTVYKTQTCGTSQLFLWSSGTFPSRQGWGT